jgi:hypothetical protein
MVKANSLRSQFKATPIKSLQKAVDKDDVMVGANNNEYLNLEDGKTTKIRIFPAHPGEENFYIACKRYWLSFNGDDGEMRRGTVYDSILHGGTEMDLVQEYVRFAKKKYGTDTAKMEALLGTGMNSQSLNPQYSWMCYASVVKEGEKLSPKLWEFKKMVRDLLNKLAFSEDEDEPIEVDPFTDPDEGTPVLVKYNKNPNRKKGEQYYEVSLAKKPRPITDEELETFANIKPLNEVIPTYSMRDFDRALEGLQNWDEANDFNLFDDDEWLEIVEKVKAQYEGGSDDEDEEKPKHKKTVKKPAPKKVEEEEDDDDADDSEDEGETDTDDEDVEDEADDDEDEGDEYTDMDRKQLKRVIKDKGLSIVVKTSMSDDDIREAIRAAVKSDDDTEEETDDDEDDADDTEEEEKPKTKVSLADIRKKLAGKK